jgi:hypothetical protein
MIEEEFYAAIKLVSGEEIFALVSVSEEDNRTLLILDNPVIITPMSNKVGIIAGYKVEPWMSIPDDDMYIIDVSKVITMTEVKDVNMINIYHKFNKSTSRVTIDRKMGFISKVDEARKTLEKAYRNS